MHYPINSPAYGHHEGDRSMNQTEKAKHNLIESTVKKTADLGTKLALSFVPGASIAYEVAKLGVSQATAFVQQKKRKDSPGSTKCCSNRMKNGMRLLRMRV